jgi:salicylate biosynthesis isochorismate synthase/menaquinone-specific isochorismate synthase
MRDRVAEEPEGLPAGAGPFWATGLAFRPVGGTEATWSSLPPALAVMPELSIARSEDRAFLTASLVLEPGTEMDPIRERVAGRLAGLRPAPLTPADPHPSAATAITGRHSPERYERIVAAAIERIRSGDLSKVVLARELTVRAPAAIDPGAMVGALRGLFPSCFCFCFGTPEAAFVGASPELLVRRSGAVAATVALAGTTSRSADPAVDDHLGEAMLRSPKVRDEHGIVVRRIERTLRPHSVWVHAEGEPFVIKVGNLQHLATPIRAQLAESHSAVQLAGYLHPTPAIGGEPRDRALELIAELEGIDRGWYTGPVGWMDAAEDGEFCVGLRSALLRDREAHLFAGCGIVADSDPSAELQESELKFEALLPLLAS